MFGFGFFRKDREVLANHAQKRRALAKQRVEDLYDSMAQAVTYAKRYEQKYAHAMASGDTLAALDAQQKHNRLVIAAHKAQQAADRIECELIWDLPTAPEGD